MPRKKGPKSRVQGPKSAWARVTLDLGRLDFGLRYWSRWKESNLHRPIIDRVLLPLSYTAEGRSKVSSAKSKVGFPVSDFGHWTFDWNLVGPTGLEPALYGLKVRYSATRVPGQQQFRVSRFGFRVSFARSNNSKLETRNSKLNKIGCGGRIRTFDDLINNQVPYQLGYATKNGCGSRS